MADKASLLNSVETVSIDTDTVAECQSSGMTVSAWCELHGKM